MFDPFNNYLGLNELVRVVKNDGVRQPSSSPGSSGYQARLENQAVQRQRSELQVLEDDFNANGRTLPLENYDKNNLASYNLQLPVKMSDITELSRVMQRHERRGSNVNGSRVGRPPIVSWCVFCKNNGESELVYGSHKLKSEDGITLCPILRAYTCPLCGQSGDTAHTVKYCSLNAEGRSASGTSPGTFGTQHQTSQYRTPRTSTGRRRSASLSLTHFTGSPFLL